MALESVWLLGVWGLLLASVGVVVVAGQWRARGGARAGVRTGVRAAGTLVAGAMVLVLAAAWGAWGSAYGMWIWAALSLSWMAQALLASARSKLFLLGLGATLAARLALAVACSVLEQDRFVSVSGALTLGSLAYLFVLAPLQRAVPMGLRRGMIALVAMLVLLVASAMGATSAGRGPILLLAALLLVLADLVMVRQRFVRNDWLGSALGTPLLVAALVLFAYSITE